MRRILESRLLAEGKILQLESLAHAGKYLVVGCVWESGRQDILRYTRNPSIVFKLLRIDRCLAPLSSNFPRIKEFKFYPGLGGWIILEEKLTGVHLQHLKPTVNIVEGVAETLAQLNQVASSHWDYNGLWPHSSSYYSRYYGRWFKRRLKRWFSWNPTLNQTVQKGYKAWFDRFQPLIDKITCFNLLHRDLAPGNCLYQDGQVQMVDFGNARFGVFWEDYFLAEFYFTGENQKLQQVYQQRYFEVFCDPELELKQQVVEFFRAFTYLRILSRPHYRFRRNQDTEHMKRYARYERLLRELVEG